MGLLDSIKRDAKKSGQNKGKFIYIREGTKVRIRFLVDMDEGIEVTWHDSYEQGINVPGLRHEFGLPQKTFDLPDGKILIRFFG